MAPTDLTRLTLPVWAVPTEPRVDTVAAQEIPVRRRWWGDEIRSRSLPGDPPASDTLTRADVWRHATGLDSGDAVFTLLWHALAWGSGRYLRQNARRLDAIAADPNRARDLLRASAKLSIREPAEAFAVLRPDRGKIKYLGPAFFTKFLYFAGAGAPDHPCLILDRVVATALRDRCGWDSLHRAGPWPAETYARYCTLLGRWAEEHGVAPDEIELRLFSGRPEVVGRRDQGVADGLAGGRTSRR
jgi:hypothetical protein